QGGVVQQLLSRHQFQYTPTAIERSLGNAGSVLVADVRVQGGNQADGVFHQLAAAGFVGGDAIDAELTQHVHGAGQQADRVEDLVGDQRLHHVQLQLAALGGQGQRQVVADHFESDLVDRFRDHRVDLARHDRA